MAITRQKKESTLVTLQDKLGRMKSLVFTHYQGLTVKDVTNLRRQLRQQEVEFMVVKKTLLRRALKNASLDPTLVERLEGSIALAFGFTDEVAPAKSLQQFSKDHPAVELIGAIINGELMSAAQTVALAKLPGRNELRGQVVWILGSPISGLVNITTGALRSLINVLNAIKEPSPATAG